MLTNTNIPEDYIPEDDFEFFTSVGVASDSDAIPDGSLGMGQDFEIIILIALGIIIGILLVGSRRFK